MRFFIVILIGVISGFWGCSTQEVQVKKSEPPKEVFSRISFYLEALYGEPGSFVVKNEAKKMLLRVYQEPFLTEKQFTDATLERKGTDKYVVMMKVDEAGSKKVADITEKNKGRRVAVVFDDTLAATPYIKDRIINGKLRFNGRLSLRESELLLAKIKGTIEKNKESHK